MSSDWTHGPSPRRRAPDCCCGSASRSSSHPVPTRPRPGSVWALAAVHHRRGGKALGTTRRVAIPLLEFLDRARITERLPDDRRRLRPR